MMTVPLKVSEHEFDLFVVLEQDNLDRMREHDPAELVKKNLGEPWTELQIRNVVITSLSPEESRKFPQRMRADPKAALRWLTRGFRYRPDRGDHDEPDRSVKGTATDLPGQRK